MQVKIEGKPKSDNISISLLENATKFYCERLLTKRLLNNIFIHIELETFQKNTDEYAFCDTLGDNNRPRDFIITLDRKLNRKEMLMALAHECVHVKQFAKGELKDIFRPYHLVKWKGEKFDPAKSDYWELPYEIEAYGREKGLYVKFFTYLKENNIFL